MFGKILKIDNNEITIENISKKALSSIMNCHLVFVDPDRLVVGELIYIDKEIARVLLVGEIKNHEFISGTIQKPSGTSNIRIINSQELELIIGKNEVDQNGNITIYVTEVIQDSMGTRFLGVENDDEWSKIKDVLRQLAKKEEA